MDDSAVESAMAIARAFREATEWDTMDLMNIQSKISNIEEGGVVMFSNVHMNGRLESMKYYVVSAPWLRKAWRSVLKPPARISQIWLENVGIIDNSNLIELLSPLNDSKSPQHQQFAGDYGNGGTNGYQLRKDLQHEQDFYLIGSQAYLLLSQKFGVSHDISAIVRMHTTNESKFVVDIYNHSNIRIASNGLNALIPIPASGRFPYETSLDNFEDTLTNGNPQGSDEVLPKEGRQLIVVPVMEDSEREGQQHVSDESDTGAVHPVSSDGLKYASSGGVPEDDEMSTEDDKQQGGILLLPPSTTANIDNSSLYSPVRKVRASATSPNVMNDFGFDLTANNGTASTSDDYWTMDSVDITSGPVMAPVTTVTWFRHGSGLANLGNTCFMNSTLQCLGHTQPLQRYFLTGEFRRDLNVANPLGTGGELASAFAKLLAEMWKQETTTNMIKSSSLFQDSNVVNWSYATNHVMYPRDFKYIVGKHAEQFMGYDQHDSQEFATYLLDALHEDTNRVTSKPYIEKPEQEDGESDEAAAAKAWGLHLQRENSKIMENFMGQVKSRVQCSETGCGRVSTTFDPFLYLSVPIPGSSERTIRVYYVPLDPAKRLQKISVSLPKSATIQELCKRVKDQLPKLGINEDPALEDLCPTDVWQKELYTWYNLNDEVDKIRDTDDTYIFALRPASEIRATSHKSSEEGDDELEVYNIKEPRKKRFSLDLPTMTRLNAGDAWTSEFAKYLRNHLGFLNAFNQTKGTTDDRVKLFQRANNFLEQCFTVTKDMDISNATQVNDDVIPELVERCDASPVFENVKSLHDLAILEFCAAKMRAEILRMIKSKKDDCPGGIKVYIRHRAGGAAGPSARSQNACGPMILRVPANTTVYGLREELAKRLARCLRRPGDMYHTQSLSGQTTSESQAANPTGGSGSQLPLPNGGFVGFGFGSPELMIMRQVPLTCERKNPSYSVKSYDNSRQLGSLEMNRGYRTTESGRAAVLANPRDSEESHIVSHTVGDQGTVTLEWPSELLDQVFDTEEFDAVEEPTVAGEGEDSIRLKKSAENRAATVLDCIEKYCQMEQLEETEMWYCNRCKKHVRAWKQFHLYRAPPILMVHLKRFHYSAATHRRDKINVFIDFPLEGLDLTEQVRHWSEGEKPIYDCYAVSNHYGGLGGGHYTAHALNDDRVWCYYDDSRITTNVDQSSIVTDAAYVLYYRRRDIVCDGNFLINLQTPEPEGPAIISDLPDSKAASTLSEVSGSNAAVVDDDNMEVEDTGSHCTSVMGSMDGVDDAEYEQHTYHDTYEQLPDDDERLPRQ